jgi:hypothetical protein
MAKLVMAEARITLLLRFSCVRPIDAEVVIIPEAMPINTRLTTNDATLQASADSSTPAVTSTRPWRSTGKKPNRSLSRPSNSRLASAPNM